MLSVPGFNAKENARMDIGPWIFMHHLWNSAGSQTSRDLQEDLFKKFREVGDLGFDYFLPQICSMLAIWEPERCPTLEQFFLEKCMNSIHSALKSFWYLHTMSEYASERVRKRCDNLRNDIETVVVNSKLPSRFYQNMPRPKVPCDMESLMFKQKIAEYFNSQIDLIVFFENLSDRLQEYSKEHRKKLLQKNLEHISKNLRSGLYFPLQHHSNERHLSLQCPIPEAGRIMNSKNKVPFMMTWEVNCSEKKCSDSRIPSLLSRNVNKPIAAAVSKPKPNVDIEKQLDRSDMHALSLESPRSQENRKKLVQKIEKEQAKEDKQVRTELLKLQTRESERVKKVEKSQSHHQRTNSKFERNQNWNPFKPSMAERAEEWRKQSLCAAHCKNWSIQTVLFKAGEDLRQEALAIQFMHLFNVIFKEESHSIRLHPFSIVPTGPYSGLVEFISDATTVTAIREKQGNLHTFWLNKFGPRDSPEYKKATKNFIETLVGYSLFCYILQVKDRHNGNIMILADGSIVHIDFGFIFTHSPGQNIGFESAPFKLTEEYIEIMGGETGDSDDWSLFQLLMIKGFVAIKKHMSKFILLTEIMLAAPEMECFVGGRQTVLSQLRERFCENMTQEDVIHHVCSLIEESVGNWRTEQYDNLQRITNNIQ